MKMRSYAATNLMAYNISFAASAGYTGVASYDNFEWRKLAYEFCTIDSIACHLIIFNSFDYNSKFVTSYYYNINPGACADTFTSANWYVGAPIVIYQ
jgi:hypothetical protein